MTLRLGDELALRLGALDAELLTEPLAGGRDNPLDGRQASARSARSELPMFPAIEVTRDVRRKPLSFARRKSGH